MKKKLITEFESFLKKDQVISDEVSIQVYQRDGLSGYSGLPSIVILPESELEIIKVIRLCNMHNTPVVTRGAGTGLSGGAVPSEGSVVLSTSRLNKILDVDQRRRVAIVQPGVRNILISQAVKDLNLFYALIRPLKLRVQ